jgi:ABC-2 type transport system ATP-binding protein
VRRLVDLEETTILLTTHDLDEAEKLADRILILAGGRIVADGSAEELARSVSSESNVRWRMNGEIHSERTPDATAFVRDLLVRFDTGISDLDVRGTTLEETYLAMVQRHESGYRDEAAQAFEEVDR